MSRDYKPGPERAKSASKGSPFFSGLLVGVLLGVGASLAVVMFIKGGESPFADLSNNKKPVAEKIAEDVKKAADAESGQQQNSAGTQDDKAKFDF